MSITLNADIRNNLFSLQQTSKDIGDVQTRIATGKKVNSPVDDPIAFFKAKGLSDKASDFLSLKDGLFNAISTVDLTLKSLDTIEDILKQMKGVAESAKGSAVVADRTAAEAQYDSLRTQLTQVATDASFDGVNLLKATPDTLSVTINTSGTTYSVAGSAADATGLAVTAGNDWDNATIATGTTNIAGDITKIETALTSVRSKASTFGSNLAFLKARTDFTEALISEYTKGAEKLTNADLNEESANLLALQTRQALAQQSLSFSIQAEQSILGLFR